MDYISTTDLRTKSPKLIEALEQGKSVSLIHRSKVVGVIKPNLDAVKPFNSSKIKKILASFPKLPKLTDSERDRIYREKLEKKYGKNISSYKCIYRYC